MILNNKNIKVDVFPEIDTVKQKKDAMAYKKLKIVEICFLFFIPLLLVCGWCLTDFFFKDLMETDYSLLVHTLLETTIFIVSVRCFFLINDKCNSMHTTELYNVIDSYHCIWKNIENSVKSGNAKIKVKINNNTFGYSKLKISYLDENGVLCKERFWLRDVYYKDSPDDRITISFYSTEEKDWTPFEDNEYVSITLPISYLYKKEEKGKMMDNKIKMDNKVEGDE